MQFDRLKRDGFPTLLGGAGPLGKRAQQSPSDSGARTPDRPIHVLILIPTLNVGGAEMDLLRTVPRIDRARFRVTVCTFLERGELSRLMQGQGIEVIGPFSSLYSFRLRLRRMAKRLLSVSWWPLQAKLSALRRLVRRISQQISQHISLRLWVPLAAKLNTWRRRIRRILRPIRRILGPIFSPLWAPVAAKLSVLRQVVRRLNWLRSLPKLGFSALRRAITTGLKLPRTVVYLMEIVRIARPIALYIRSSEVDVVTPFCPIHISLGLVRPR